MGEKKGQPLHKASCLVVKHGVSRDQLTLLLFVIFFGDENPENPAIFSGILIGQI